MEKLKRPIIKKQIYELRKLAKSLKNIGIKLGDTLGTIAWSNIRHLELYYGISGIGAICHTINPRLFKEQLIFIINDAKDKILFVDLDFMELISEITNNIDTVEKIVFLCEFKDLPKNYTIKQEVIAYED